MYVVGKNIRDVFQAALQMRDIECMYEGKPCLRKLCLQTGIYLVMMIFIASLPLRACSKAF